MANTNDPFLFDPEVQGPADENYTQRSEGRVSQKYAPVLSNEKPEQTVFAGGLRKVDDAPTEWKTYVTPIIVDKSKAILTDAIGTAAVQGIQLADLGYKSYIRGQVQESYDQANQGFFNKIGAGTLFEGDDQTPPEELVKQAAKMDDLTTAVKNGTMSRTHYWANMTKLSQELRGRFPLYSDYVDEQIQKTMGADPANRLRESILSDLETASSKESDEDKQYRKNLDDGIVPPDFQLRMNQGKPYSKAEVNAWALERKRFRQELDFAKERITTAPDVKSNDVYRTAHYDFWGKVADTFRGTASAMEAQREFTSLREKKQSGQTLSPQEERDFNAVAAKMQSIIQGVGLQILNGPVKGTDGPTYAQIMTNPEDVKKFNEMVSAAAESYVLGMKVPEWSKVNAASLDEATAGLALDMTSVSEGMFTTAALTRAAGGAASAEFLVKNLGGTFNAKEMANISRVVHGAMTGVSTKAIVDDIQERVQSQQMTPQEAFGSIVESANQISNTNLDPKLRGNLARSLFAKDPTSMVRKDAQGNEKLPPKEDMWLKFTQPDFVKGMVDLKDKDPKAYNDYAHWVAKTYADINRNALHRVQGVFTSQPNMSLQVDDNMEFKPVYTGDYSKESAAGTIYQKWFGEPAQAQAMNEINASTRGYIQALQTLGFSKEEAKQAVMAQWMAQGWDPTAPYAGGTLTQLGTLIKGALKSAWDAESDNFKQKLGYIKQDEQNP